MKRLIVILALLVIVPWLYGSPALAMSPKVKEQKHKMINEIRIEIEKLGGDPISEDDAKFKKDLKKGKYYKALQEQRDEIIKSKEDEKAKAEADKKAEEEKLKAEEQKKKTEKERADTIQQIKNKIYFLGETPILEFELGSEDKYIAALKKQIEEIEEQKKKEEKEINESIPEWFVKMPQGTDTLMYVRGTAVSDSLQGSIDIAEDAAKRSLVGKIETRLNSKTKETVKQAGMGENIVSKTEINRISAIVVKEVTISGFEVVESKMVKLDNGDYRVFILLKYPVSQAYKAYLDQIKSSDVLKGDIAKLKNTEAFKDLEKAVREFAGS
jgi:hypothetical protein|tara:strand:+ start:480 stop:1460 length:981 start_codon:yes stop_codon:yes gene_type:complete